MALGLAVLAGLAAARIPKRALLVPALVLPLVACWPLIRGRGVDDQLLWDRIPAAWTEAARHVDAHAGDGRAVVLPGQLYAYYDWGGTIDPILPVLADTPVATRNAVGYADLRATDLLWTVDALVQQRRALPGPARPAAGPDGRDDRGRGRRRRPHPQRRRARRRGGRRARPARAARRRPGARERPSRAPRERSATRSSCRRSAPGTGRRRRACVRVEAPDPWLVVDGSAEGLAVDAPSNLPLLGLRLRRRPLAGRAAAREGGRDHRLQPPAGARAVAAGAERGPGAGGGRAAVGRRRRARPVRARAATRRPSPSTAAASRA